MQFLARNGAVTCNWVENEWGVLIYPVEQLLVFLEIESYIGGLKLIL